MAEDESTNTNILVAFSRLEAKVEVALVQHGGKIEELDRWRGSQDLINRDDEVRMRTIETALTELKASQPRNVSSWVANAIAFLFALVSMILVLAHYH